jgi:hypothetical protein
VVSSNFIDDFYMVSSYFSLTIHFTKEC